MFEMMLGGGKVKSVGDYGELGEGAFIREVPASEFITGIQLATSAGITEGNPLSDAGWLHFTLGEKTLYVSKRPLRSHISWDHINSVGAVFGTKTTVVKGDTYKVRLLSGANSNPSTAATGSSDHLGTHGCEWNRLLYHISAKPFAHSNNTLASEGIVVGDWASYAEADIGMALAYLSGAAGYGAFQWCQETGTTGTTRVVRGYVGVSHSNQDTPSSATSGNGWRAVLELME